MALFCLFPQVTKRLYKCLFRSSLIWGNNNIAAVRWGGKKDRDQNSRKLCFLKEAIKEWVLTELATFYWLLD